MQSSSPYVASVTNRPPPKLGNDCNHNFQQHTKAQSKGQSKARTRVQSKIDWKQLQSQKLRFYKCC
jgi:hypothetical protein